MMIDLVQCVGPSTKFSRMQKTEVCDVKTEGFRCEDSLENKVPTCLHE